MISDAIKKTYRTFMLNDPPAATTSTDLTGHTLGDYQILRRLGRGGMAEVYLARQLSLKRNVALKILKPELAKDTSYIERFQREAQSAALLVQANIVQIYEVGELDGFHFIAQEYVIGRNLREYIARNGAVKPVMAINVLRQVALALKKADEFNVIHRDIKPENIMMSPSGEVKVTDFGLARINDSTDKNLTQIGMTMGTPLYMSPEQVEGSPVDIRSDIYSLGVSTYHMLAGKPPFDGETALAIAVQHVKNHADSLAIMRPDVPKELIQLIDLMMSKSPDERPQNAGQLLKSVKAIKVDDADDWDQLVETLAIETSATKPVDSIPDSRLAATKQLQSVMRGNIRSWWTSNTTIASFFLLGVGGILLGLGLAKSMPVNDPIFQSGEIAIPKQTGAREQYDYAYNYSANDPDYYQAVIDYFGNGQENTNQSRIWINRALERQSEIYLINKQYDLAKPIYESFTASDSNDNRYIVVGNAGLAIINHDLAINGDLSEEEKESLHDDAKNRLRKIVSQIDTDLNQFLQRRLKPLLDYYFENSSIARSQN